MSNHKEERKKIEDELNKCSKKILIQIILDCNVWRCRNEESSC